MPKNTAAVSITAENNHGRASPQMVCIAIHLFQQVLVEAQHAASQLGFQIGILFSVLSFIADSKNADVDLPLYLKRRVVGNAARQNLVFHTGPEFLICIVGHARNKSPQRARQRRIGRGFAVCPPGI